MWYSSGTVSVETGSSSVIGDGTDFLANVRVGDGMAIEGSLALHEIINVASETGITISPAYEGVSGTGMRFTVVPVLGYDKDLSDAFNRIRLEMGAKVQGLQPWAYASTVDESRDGLGLGSAATGDVVQESGDSQANVMSQKATSDALDAKVDKELGKGLSESDYTTAEKTKLAGVATGATKNRADSENADKVHTHTWSQITGQPAQATRWPTFGEVTGKPATYPPSDHTHTIAQVTGLDTALSNLETSVDGLESDLSDLRSDLSASTISYNYTTNTYDLSKHRITSTHKACRRCLLSDDGNVNYYLDQHDSNKKEDGTTADLTGGDGQVMVEIPRFWFGVKHIGETIQLTQSPIPLPGLIPHPVFTTGGDFDAVYVGAYNATVQQPDGTIIPGLNLDNNTARVSLDADKLSSLSGGDNYAMAGLSLGEFRILANNRGEGWEEFSFLAWQALQVLGYTFLGSFNGQTALGNGNVFKSYLASSSVQSDSPHTLNGASNHLGNEAGATDDFMSLLGVENLWGQCWQWVDGVLFQDAQAYVSAVPASTITADYYPVGAPISQAGASGSYISRFQNLVNSILIPGAGSGDSSRFVGDGFWWSGGLRGAIVGGGAHYGAWCGLACLHTLSAPGGRYRNFGGRVMFKRSRG